MKVLVADKFEKSGLDGLAKAGCEVLYDPDLKDDALVEAIRASGAVALVVRSTKVTRPMLEAGRLSLVVRAGAGYNTIDVETASERGISVANCPGKNAIAVAELAFGLILALDRRIPENTADLKRGVWNKKEYSKARGLYGRTLGLIGLGGIGREVARIGEGMGMNVIGWNRTKHPEIAVPLVDIDALLARSDVVSMNLTLGDETRGFLSAERIARMKKGAIYINTARGALADETALIAALQSGHIRHAGLDVFHNEPLSPDHVLAKLENVTLSAHAAFRTPEASETLLRRAIDIVKAIS